jgi:quercetin dioxygenase-like cupin family protein
MRITRFITTADGGSRFVQMDLPVSTPYTDEFGNVYSLSEAISCTGVIADLPAGLDQDWHVAPGRQLVIVMTGALEVQTTDGQIRRFQKGDLFMADDPKGRGHQTRVLEGPALLMFLKVPEDFDADRWTQK